jgi:uncharacterized protein YndB with AHSA1/START domain
MTLTLVIIGIAVVALLVFVATRPDTFRIVRSATIGAPAQRVFGSLDDFHQWTAWSPWERLDPGLSRTHSGAPKGKGAVYEWSGNKQVGRGRMEIIEVVPPDRLTIKLDFLAPFEAHNTTAFSLTPSGGNATLVTWEMTGRNTFMGKAMSVFMNMDRLIGRDFEKGLANLKAVAEGL